MTSPGPPPSAFTVLLVCTGNICRSALAERLGRSLLEEALAKDADSVRLASAGTRAVVDSAMHPDTAFVLSGFGGDAGDFRARQLTEGIAAEADLIVTMTRLHQREVLRLAPRALARTFTLREAADLLGLIGDDGQASGGWLAERARALVAQMAAARSLRHGGAHDDIRDPIGLPVDVHQEVAETIVEALLPVLHRLTRRRVDAQTLDLPARAPGHAADGRSAR